MRTTRTWTISLPPALSRLAGDAAHAEQRTKSELMREALRLYLAQRGRRGNAVARSQVERVGELADFYRQRHPATDHSESALRKQFRGVKRTHQRLRRLAP